MRVNFKLAAIALALASAFGAAQAATTDGNLTVTTTVSANCNAPSPSGNLVLPFDGSSALTSQGLATEISVAISCSGSPTLSTIAFGVGANGPTTTERALKLSGGSALLGYKLYAKTSTGAGTTEVSLLALTAGSPATGAATSTVSLSGSSATVYVNGRVYHTNGGNETSYASAGAVAAGTYNDTVSMTVTYN